MKAATLEDWLDARTPEVPEPFLPLLLQSAGGFPSTPEELERLAEEALGLALNQPGRKRGAAFPLLTGDAFLTYACEALAEEEGDLGEGLDGLIHNLGTRFP